MFICLCVAFTLSCLCVGQSFKLKNFNKTNSCTKYVNRRNLYLVDMVVYKRNRLRIHSEIIPQVLIEKYLQILNIKYILKFRQTCNKIILQVSKLHMVMKSLSSHLTIILQRSFERDFFLRVKVSSFRISPTNWSTDLTIHRFLPLRNHCHGNEF